MPLLQGRLNFWTLVWLLTTTALTTARDGPPPARIVLSAYSWQSLLYNVTVQTQYPQTSRRSDRVWDSQSLSQVRAFYSFILKTVIVSNPGCRFWFWLFLYNRFLRGEDEPEPEPSQALITTRADDNNNNNTTDIKNPSDSGNTSSWNDQLAAKYYATLYREFALCDLKHYKSGNVSSTPPSSLQCNLVLMILYEIKVCPTLADRRRSTLRSWGDDMWEYPLQAPSSLLFVIVIEIDHEGIAHHARTAVWLCGTWKV